MNLATVRELLNTAVHAAIVFLAIHIPADIFDVANDKTVIMASASAGVVAVIHKLNDILPKN